MSPQGTVLAAACHISHASAPEFESSGDPRTEGLFLAGHSWYEWLAAGRCHPSRGTTEHNHDDETARGQPRTRPIRRRPRPPAGGPRRRAHAVRSEPRPTALSAGGNVWMHGRAQHRWVAIGLGRWRAVGPLSREAGLGGRARGGQAAGRYVSSSAGLLEPRSIAESGG